MQKGYIKLYRKLLEDPIMEHPQLCNLFIYCLLRANHTTAKAIVSNKMVTVQRGSFITGKEKLGAALKQKETTLWDALSRLDELKYIHKNSNHNGTMVTVLNYDSYLTESLTGRPKVRQKSNRSPTEVRQKSDTYNNEKNENNDKNEKNEKTTKVSKTFVVSFLHLIPEELSSIDSFTDTWKEWVLYRRELGKKLTHSGAKKQLDFLLKQEDPVRVIEESIKNGWQGLFETWKSNLKLKSGNNGSYITDRNKPSRNGLQAEPGRKWRTADLDISARQSDG